MVSCLWNWFDGYWERSTLDWDPGSEQALRISNARAEVCALILNIFRRMLSQGASQSGVGVRLLFMADANAAEKVGKRQDSLQFTVRRRIVSLVNKMSEDLRYERYVRHPLLMARATIPLILSDLVDEALKLRHQSASTAMSYMAGTDRESGRSSLPLSTRGELERFDLSDTTLNCVATGAGIGPAMTRGLANASALLRRAAMDGSGASEIHLLYWLPLSIASRRQLLRSLLKMDASLCESATWYPSPGGVVAGGSGLMEALLTTCLGDTAGSSKVQVDKYTLPADFVRYNRRWVVRDEAIALLRLLITHAVGPAAAVTAVSVKTVGKSSSSRAGGSSSGGGSAPGRALSSAGAFMREELVRNIVKYGVVEAERNRPPPFTPGQPSRTLCRSHVG
jgi:hypothetical protein